MPDPRPTEVTALIAAARDLLDTMDAHADGSTSERRVEEAKDRLRRALDDAKDPAPAPGPETREHDGQVRPMDFHDREPPAGLSRAMWRALVDMKVMGQAAPLPNGPTLRALNQRGLVVGDVLTVAGAALVSDLPTWCSEPCPKHECGFDCRRAKGQHDAHRCVYCRHKWPALRAPVGGTGNEGGTT